MERVTWSLPWFKSSIGGSPGLRQLWKCLELKRHPQCVKIPQDKEQRVMPLCLSQLISNCFCLYKYQRLKLWSIMFDIRRCSLWFKWKTFNEEKPRSRKRAVEAIVLWMPPDVVTLAGLPLLKPFSVDIYSKSFGVQTHTFLNFILAYFQKIHLHV